MSQDRNKYLKFGAAITLIVLTLAYLAYLGAQESKSYYVTIKELHAMGDDVYKKNLRVAGNVLPGSIKMSGPHAVFELVKTARRCTWSIKALSRRRTLSRTTPRRWPWASISTM